MGPALTLRAQAKPKVPHEAQDSRSLPLSTTKQHTAASTAINTATSTTTNTAAAVSAGTNATAAATINAAAARVTISAAALNRWQHEAMASSLGDPLLIFKVVWYHLIGKKNSKTVPNFFITRKVPILLRINATVDFLSTIPTRNLCHRTQKTIVCVARVSTSPYIPKTCTRGDEKLSLDH